MRSNTTLAGRVLLTSALLVLPVVGCGTVNTTTTRQAPSEDQVDTRTQVNDLFTQIFLKATDVRMFPTKGGPLQTQVDVANDGFRTRSFSYRFEWLDARGNVIPSSIYTWKATSVPAGGSIMISSVAPSEAATDFKLQLRRGQ